MAIDEEGRFWWHSIELPNGRITPGEKSVELLDEQWSQLRLPDLAGCTVLDVGAWDGWFSFRAEREGAARVVALDHFVWSLDFARSHEYHEYVRRCEESGVRPDTWGPDCAWWDAAKLPGKVGFDTARSLLQSDVEPIVTDFMACDVDQLEVFDVVLYLGVLYHMEEPLTALRRLRRVTGALAVVETAAIAVDGQEDRPTLEFISGMEVNRDPTNWFFPNEAAAHALLRVAGFDSVETVARTQQTNVRPGVTDLRLTLHARPGPADSPADRPLGRSR